MSSVSFSAAAPEIAQVFALRRVLDTQRTAFDGLATPPVQSAPVARHGTPPVQGIGSGLDMYL